MCKLAALQDGAINFFFVQKLLGSNCIEQLFMNGHRCSQTVHSLCLLIFSWWYLLMNTCLWTDVDLYQKNKQSNWEISMFVYSPWFLVKNLWIILLKFEAQILQVCILHCHVTEWCSVILTMALSLPYARDAVWQLAKVIEQKTTDCWSWWETNDSISKG